MNHLYIRLIALSATAVYSFMGRAAVEWLHGGMARKGWAPAVVAMLRQGLMTDARS
jgi:hypothetical protein